MWRLLIDCWMSLLCFNVSCKVVIMDRQEISGQVETLNPVCFTTQRGRWIVLMCGALRAEDQASQGPVTTSRKVDINVSMLATYHLRGCFSLWKFHTIISDKNKSEFVSFLFDVSKYGVQGDLTLTVNPCKVLNYFGPWQTGEDYKGNTASCGSVGEPFGGLAVSWPPGKPLIHWSMNQKYNGFIKVICFCSFILAAPTQWYDSHFSEIDCEVMWLHHCPLGALCIFFTRRHLTACYKSSTIKRGTFIYPE